MGEIAGSLIFDIEVVYGVGATGSLLGVLDAWMWWICGIFSRSILSWCGAWVCFVVGFDECIFRAAEARCACAGGQCCIGAGHLFSRMHEYILAP